MKFDNIEQLSKCANEWCAVLGLQDWCIVYELRDEDSASAELGHNDYDFESKTSVVTIYKTVKNDYFNVFQEETLIHELLHCKYPIAYNGENAESVLCASFQHQVLNDMARALFMTKYGMTIEDYKNETKK